MDRSTRATLSTYNTWIQLSRLHKIYHFQSPNLRLAAGAAKRTQKEPGAAMAPQAARSSQEQRSCCYSGLFLLPFTSEKILLFSIVSSSEKHLHVWGLKF